MRNETDARRLLAAIEQMSNGPQWNDAAGIHGTAVLRWLLEEPAPHDRNLNALLNRRNDDGEN